MAGVSSPNDKDRMNFEGKINNIIDTIALIDTGAQCSIISAKLAKRIGGICSDLLPRVSGYDGQVSNALGIVHFSFALRNTQKSIQLNALVVNKCNPDLILGLDEIQRLGFSVISPDGIDCLSQNPINSFKHNGYNTTGERT